MVTPRDRRRPTLAEVAQAAGVGKATASRALAATAHPDVSAQTRALVHSVAQELGYRPSSTARALRTGRFHTLSIVVPYDLWEWLEPTLMGAGEEAARAGYHLLVHPIDTRDAGIVPLLDRITDLPTDALIMIDPLLTPAQEERLRTLDLPLIFIDDTAEHPWAATICGANRDGGYRATRHLVECGRTRIAAVVPPGRKRYVLERLAGYRTALAEAGLPHGEELVLTAPKSCSRSFPVVPSGVEALEPGRDFDAVFAFADYLASGVLRSLRQAKVRVPEDVSVVGFDDERAAVLVDPPLTTVRQPTAEMGRMAVRFAVQAAEGETVQAGVRELPVELVVRESSVPGGAAE